MQAWSYQGRVCTYMQLMSGAVNPSNAEATFFRAKHKNPV